MKFAQFDHLYQRYGYRLALIAAFLLPLKLSLCFFALIPLILLWIIHSRLSLSAMIPSSRDPGVILLFFVLAAFLGSLFGIDPLVSAHKVLVLGFYVCLVFAFRDVSADHRYRTILLMLLCGQSIAALHSIFQGAFPTAIGSYFIGKVSESGQLSLVIPLAYALFLSYRGDSRSTPASYSAPLLLWGFGNSILFTALSFSPLLFVSAGLNTIRGALAVLALLSLALAVRYTMKYRAAAERLGLALVVVILPLLASALLINLKRGPWFGIGVGILVLSFIHAPRVIPLIVTLGVAALVILGPVRERLKESGEHFFITGGRSAIWSIGAELATRYPLGIGFHNSPFLRNFSSEIPRELTHFHNNFLNILVETGWLGLAIYLFWLLRVFRLSFSTERTSREALLIYGLGCALLSWQCAGIVEYNFGDSEVVLMAFMLLGILTTLALPHPARSGEVAVATPTGFVR